MSTEDRARSLLEDRIAKDPWGELEPHVEDIGRLFVLAFRLNDLPQSRTEWEEAQQELRELMEDATEDYMKHNLEAAETGIILNDRQEFIDAAVDARIDESYAA